MTAEELKQRVVLSEWIGRTVDLKSAGKGHSGACPLCTCNRPALYVTDDPSLWWCFHCKQGGDIFDWLEATQNRPFKDAWAYICETEHLDGGMDGRAALNYQERNRVRDLMNEANTWFRSQLLPAHRKLLHERWGLTDETIDTAGLGFCGSGFQAAMAQVGYTDLQLYEVALLGKKKDGQDFSNFLYNRITIPFYSGGMIRYFTGRALDNPRNQKYLHLRSSKDVNRYVRPTIYQLDHLRGAKRVYICEGVMDALAIEQNTGGQPEIAAIGLLGSTRSEAPGEIDKLCRTDAKLLIVVDGDEAGVLGALSTAEDLYAKDRAPLMLKCPPGEDGASLGEAIRELEPISPIDLACEYVGGKEEDERIRAYEQIIVPMLINMHGVIQETAVTKTSQALGIDRAHIQRAIRAPIVDYDNPAEALLCQHYVRVANDSTGGHTELVLALRDTGGVFSGLRRVSITKSAGHIMGQLAPDLGDIDVHLARVMRESKSGERQQAILRAVRQMAMGLPDYSKLNRLRSGLHVLNDRVAHLGGLSPRT